MLPKILTYHGKFLVEMDGQSWLVKAALGDWCGVDDFQDKVSEKFGSVLNFVEAVKNKAFSSGKVGDLLVQNVSITPVADPESIQADGTLTV